MTRMALDKMRMATKHANDTKGKILSLQFSRLLVCLVGTKYK